MIDITVEYSSQRAFIIPQVARVEQIMNDELNIQCVSDIVDLSMLPSSVAAGGPADGCARSD